MATIRAMSLTQNQEKYCQARCEGLTQRAAYRRAYPRSAAWKDSSVDVAASKLEASAKVSQRLAGLNAEAAKAAKLSRSRLLQRLDSLADKSEKVVARVYRDDGRINFNASQALISATRELLPFAEDEPEERPPFRADFGLLLAPPFLEPHRLVAREEAADLWMEGGRGSTKSSFASLELVNHVEQHPDQHALVMMRYKNQLRDSAYAQVTWAIRALGLEDEYEVPDSTLRIRKRSTGQLVLFRGCDNPNKVKGIKIPFGHIGFVWVEETDMFRGMAEIRKVLQSATRGGDASIRVFTFNPPRSKSCWINAETARRKDAGLPVFGSTYLDVPPEWLGAQFLADAEDLRASDPQAYEHEYLGVPVGLGGDVFDRVEFREVSQAEVDAFDNLRCGQDFGWFPDPWAFTISEWQPATRTIVTWYEDGGCKLQPDEQARRVMGALTWSDDGRTEAYHHLPVLSDDADPQAIASQRDAGANARAAGKGHMREASYRFLQSCAWVIDPVRCPNLAREVREMQYERNAEGEWLSSVPDGNDHWVDATRYAFMREARSRRAYRKATGVRG